MDKFKKICKGIGIGLAIIFVIVIVIGWMNKGGISFSLPSWSGGMPDWSAMWVWAKWPVLIVVGLTTLVLLARAGTETFIRLCLMMIVGTIIYFAYKGSSEKDSVARENQNSVPRLALRYNEWLEVDNNYWGDRYYDFTCESVAYYVSRSGEEPPSSQILGQPGVPMVYHVANNNRHKVNLPKAPKYFVLARGKIVERPELILNPPN